MSGKQRGAADTPLLTALAAKGLSKHLKMDYWGGYRWTQTVLLLSIALKRLSRAVVPNLFGTRDPFPGRWGLGGGQEAGELLLFHPVPNRVGDTPRPRLEEDRTRE